MEPSAARPVATTKWPPAAEPFSDMASESSTGEPCARRSAMAVGVAATTSTSAPPVNSAARQRLTTCSPVGEPARKPSQVRIPLASVGQ